MEQKYNAREVIDAGGKPVYPGFIDAHAHFYEYGLSLQEVKLSKTNSWQEVIDSVNVYAAEIRMAGSLVMAGTRINGRLSSFRIRQS